MTKWRYKVEYVKFSAFTKVADMHVAIEERLARLGMEGWELVTAMGRADSYNVELYLKRPYQ